MAASPSLDALPCVPPAVRDTPRYVGDMVIRHYRDRTLSELAADLGTTLPDPFEVVGGIGVLTMTAHGNTFVPAIPDKPPIPEVTLDPEMVERRRAVCAVCPSYTEATDQCQMCGCAGQMSHRATRPWTKCPRGYWPELPS